MTRPIKIKPLTTEQIKDFEEFDRWLAHERAAKLADQPKRITFNPSRQKWRLHSH